MATVAALIPAAAGRSAAARLAVSSRERRSATASITETVFPASRQTAARDARPRGGRTFSAFS